MDEHQPPPQVARRLHVLAGHVQGRDAQHDVSETIDRHQCNASPPLLQGKVAVITGSGQGIGAAAARLFAQQGAAVLVSDLDAAKADAVADDIRRRGGRAASFPGDVTSPDFAERLVKAAVDAFGTIDILINNAGFTWDGVIHKMTPEQWQAMLDVHCTAPFRIIQAAAPVMRDPGKAQLARGEQPTARYIINVSSVSGTRGSAGQANYATAKMGVVGLTKTVAREWGQFGVRCNAVAYGKIATRLVAAREGGESIMVGGKRVALGIPSAALRAAGPEAVPLGRAGTVEEAAGAMLLLACPWASYVTGQVLEVNGGLYT